MTSILENIRIKAGEFFLKKQLGKQSRNVLFRNLSKIKTAGIIFEAKSPENINLVKNFIKELKKFGISTKALGYVHDHRKNIDMIGDSVFTYVCKDDYSFVYETRDEGVKEFIDQPFNLLIVYCENDYFPLRHVATLSRAELKAGEQGICDDIMDFMIHLPENKGLPELQEQLIRYLSMINKEE